MRIYYSEKFAREHKKLLMETKKLTEEKEKIFRKNPFDPKLNTDKLHGHLKEYRAFSVDKSCRIIFEFAKKDMVWFHSVGDHSIYQ